MATAKQGLCCRQSACKVGLFESVKFKCIRAVCKAMLRLRCTCAFKHLEIAKQGPCLEVTHGGHDTLTHMDAGSMMQEAYQRVSPLRAISRTSTRRMHSSSAAGTDGRYTSHTFLTISTSFGQPMPALCLLLQRHVLAYYVTTHKVTDMTRAG